MKVAVVGGGLAGLAAALDLVDAGADVTVHEARPTLGGAVQTLPARDGDPEPPPDNGQHIALGCFTEYLRFLDRVGESSARSPHAPRPAGASAEDGSRRDDRAEPRRPALAYAHLPLRDRVRIPVVTARCRGAKARTGETFGDVLRRLGASDAAIDRFWDVFIRPALNLRDRRGRRGGGALHRAHRAARPARQRRPRAAAEAARLRCTATPPAACSAGACASNERVESLDDLDADAIVVAVPPHESARLLGEPEPQLEDSPIVSVHLWFDRADPARRRSRPCSTRTRTGSSTAARSPGTSLRAAST